MVKKNGSVGHLARMFRILGDETRLKVLMLLADHGELNVTSLCKKLKSPQPTVSHHLGILRTGEMVSSRRSGKEIFYSLPDTSDHKNAKAFKAMLSDASAVRLGPVVVGMAEDQA